jgi:RNA polymerase sigma factor (sigma-70 family)
MTNPFVEEKTEVELEQALVADAQAGDRQALEKLIRLHQSWVFNIVLRMVSDYHLAEDISQEVLLKIFSKLPTFQGKSRFRTWLYRIAVNQVLNVKKTKHEEYHANHGYRWADDKYMEDYISQGLPDRKLIPAEVTVIAREVMVKCLLGMLLCLDRKQRLVYILGAILNVTSRTASEILEISDVNFRQVLSRSRRRLWNFLNERCGLINPDKPCQCERSVPANIKSGYVDPLQAIFNAAGAPRIREIVSRAEERLNNIRFAQCQELYREHPFQNSPDFSRKVMEIINGEDVQTLLDTVPRN